MYNKSFIIGLLWFVTMQGCAQKQTTVDMDEQLTAVKLKQKLKTEMQPKKDTKAKVPFGIRNSILLNMDDFHCTYGVSIKYYDKPENSLPDKRIDYQLYLDIQKNTKGTWDVTINKDRLFFNQHQADLIGEQIAAISMEAIFPIHLEVDYQWSIHGAVLNHDQILQRWEKTSKYIKSKYTGEAVDNFIQQMNESLSDKTHFIELMSNEMAWSVLFHPKNIAYGDELQKELSFIFPALPYQQLSFKGIQQIDQNIASYGDISLKYSGEHLTKTNNIKLEAQFDMDVQSKLLKNAYLECKYYAADSLEMPDKKVIFSMYRIKNKH